MVISSDVTTELVISAPVQLVASVAYQTRSRTTLGVLVQLLLDAQRHVIISAPFMQPGHGLSGGPLASALHSALERGVAVDVMSTAISLQTINFDHLRSTEAQGKLCFYRPKQNILDDQKIGSHAKFCVADGRSAYIGSANLTAPGLTDQIEMGLLVQGEIARQIEIFWMHAIDIGLFIQQ